MTKQQQISELRRALEAIRDARDYHAEHGVYPPGMGVDQCFDDWAADIASTVLEATKEPEVPADLLYMYEMIVDCDGAEIHRDEWPAAERLVKSGHITLGEARGPGKAFRRARLTEPNAR